MARSCWYRNLDLDSSFVKRPPTPTGNSVPQRPQGTGGIMSRRWRSKSTSSEAVDVDIDPVDGYKHTHKDSFSRQGPLRRLFETETDSIIVEGVVDRSSGGGGGTRRHDFDNNNVNSAAGVSNSTGDLLAGGRELLIGERIRSRTISGGRRRSSASHSHGDGRLLELVNVLLLTCVFVLGAVSAVFVIVCYKHGDFGMGPSAKRRTELFQPFPQVEELAVIDAHYLDPVQLPGLEDFREDNECDGENKLALELEAITSVRSALHRKEEGKESKAQKLFQHAMALCPRHPDVLTHYGEFFEETRQDYMTADHLYVQALAYSPGHTQALINRKRTLPVVEELDEKRLNRIDAKREQLLQLSETNKALRRIRKEAYFQHIYHSAGIEGNTMTLSQTRSIVETRIAVGGKSIVEHNEILGLDAALRYVNSSLVNRIGKIALEDILLIHKHLMSLVDPEEAGQLRKTQVFVGNHIPPPPEEIIEQMSQLVEWLNSEEALSLHPIHYAAIAHYKLVYIHPFLDGNGRTSRLLMNWVLMQANYPPVIIRKQDRMFYYDHLNTANKGDIRPFIRFIGDCTEKTMDVYIWATQNHHILEIDDDHNKDREIDN